jgi:NTP pyrophosphatase (non-canonical NTP hydrolase)
MKYSRDTIGGMQLDELVVKIAEIYSANDRNRSLWDVWCHALHHAAAIAERLRKKSPTARVFEEIADFSLWLFTAVNKLAGQLGQLKEQNETPPETLIRIQGGCSDLLWHRYPNMCPLCYVRRTKGSGNRRDLQELLRPCDCPLSGADEPQNKDEKRAAAGALRQLSEDTRSAKPKSIDEWQQMFGTVFRSNLSRISLTEVMLHLMEELGEASDAMVRMYSYSRENFVKGEPRQRQLRLESQIADVFSWLFALVETMNLLRVEIAGGHRCRSESDAVVREDIRLSEIIWRRYGSDELQSFYCPFCKQAACSCPLIFVPATRSIDELKALFENKNPSFGR